MSAVGLVLDALFLDWGLSLLFRRSSFDDGYLLVDFNFFFFLDAQRLGAKFLLFLPGLFGQGFSFFFAFFFPLTFAVIKFLFVDRLLIDNWGRGNGGRRLGDWRGFAGGVTAKGRSVSIL